MNFGQGKVREFHFRLRVGTLWSVEALPRCFLRIITQHRNDDNSVPSDFK